LIYEERDAMDAITAAALAVNDPLIRTIGMFLDNSMAYAAIIIILLFAGEERNTKRAKVLLCLALSIVIVMAVKDILAVDRPCAGSETCPKDHSFPSMHAVAAFALMTAFLDKKAFPVYLVFALFVCFTRLNLGVHTFRDISGALPIALISYYAIDMAWPRIEPAVKQLLGGAIDG
jgi:membrane-associated phospholipid phosphatase